MLFCCSGLQRDYPEILVAEIEVDQGRERASKCDRFYDPGMFDEDFGTLQSPGVRSDAKCFKLTWLEELAQRVILYRHEKILLGREDCRPGPKKTICKNLMVFHQYLGIAVRLGSRFVWYENMLFCCGGLQRDHPENPCARD